RSERRRRALDALAKVGLADRSHHQPNELSGGQQQRVFLARALVQDAEVYFMDEPFAGVDAVTEQSIASLLGHLAQRGKTILSVHHDLATVPRYFGHAVLLNRAVQAVGTVEEVFHRGNLDRLYGGRVPADVPELAST
ncbi:MAG: metal ABC transporter ATP-binding protein, partial [Planctomycetota bacterium]